MPLVVENSETPRPIWQKQPRYLNYKNARKQASNLWVCEIGMGAHPKVWRTAYICERQDGDGLRLKGWIYKVWDNFFTVFYLPYELFGMRVKGQFRTYETAHDFLVRCAEQFGGD
jgi:hypothetical protein